MKLEFMKNHNQEFNVEKMAQILGVGRSSYYEFIGRTPSQRAIKNECLTEEIKNIYEESRKTYGSPRVQAKLKDRGETCSRRRVARLMQKAGLQAKMRKKWKITTKAGKDIKKISPNYLDQQFKVESPNKVWGSDITYVSTQEGWLYVSVVLDLFSRRVVGLSMGNRLDTTIVIRSVGQALFERQPK